jgi:hypothetical protein
MNILTSWRTTLAGGLPAVILILTELLHWVDSDPATTVNLLHVLSALGLIGVGVFARDNSVTSRQAGAE